MVLSIKLRYKNQLNTAAVKACKTIKDLARILPKVGGSKQQTRMLLRSVTQNRLLFVYAVLIWEGSMVFQS